MRAVFDAGILIRANRKASGPVRALLEIITGPLHSLILSPHILAEKERAFEYPQVKKLFHFHPAEIQEYIEYLESVAEIVDPKVTEPVVFRDPNDDPVLYTAVVSKANVLCTLDRHFYDPHVLAFCRMRDIRVMNDVELLLHLNRGEVQ
jgi:putative PIN family toxin of toxin-antitoxin system